MSFKRIYKKVPNFTEKDYMDFFKKQINYDYTYECPVLLHNIEENEGYSLLNLTEDEESPFYKWVDSLIGPGEDNEGNYDLPSPWFEFKEYDKSEFENELFDFFLKDTDIDVNEFDFGMAFRVVATDWNDDWGYGENKQFNFYIGLELINDKFDDKVIILVDLENSKYIKF